MTEMVVALSTATHSITPTVILPECRQTRFRTTPAVRICGRTTGSVAPGLRVVNHVQRHAGASERRQRFRDGGVAIGPIAFHQRDFLVAKDLLHGSIGKCIAFIDEARQAPARREIHQQRPAGRVEFRNTRRAVGLPLIDTRPRLCRIAGGSRCDIGEANRQKYRQQQ